MNTTETKTNICPVCGKAYVEEYEICEVCDWQNDPIQKRHPTWEGGANQMSLEQALIAYKEKKPIR